MSPTTKVLVVAFAFGAFETFVIASQVLWFTVFARYIGVIPTSETVAKLSSYTAVVGLLVDPVAVFLTMFVLGRRLDLRSGAVRTFAALVAGTLAGTLFSLAAVGVTLYAAGDGSILVTVLASDLVYDGIGSFRMAMVGFAGAALAHLAGRSNESTPDA